MAHTPGPWITNGEFEHESVFGPNGVLVADCATFHKTRTAETNQANARLVAAAPYLMELAQRSLDLLRGGDFSDSILNEESAELQHYLTVVISQVEAEGSDV